MLKLKKMSILLLIAVMILSSGFTAFGAVASPPDVVGTPYAVAVNQLVTDGILSGYSDGSFQPEKQISRAEACKLIVAALGIKDLTGYKSSFSDLTGYAWADGYIGYAVKAGVALGYPDGTFKPGNPVTENEMITMLVRALGYSDAALGGSWPTNFVNKASELGITTGTAFGATKYANRGMAALLTYNAFYKVNDFSKTDKLGIVISKAQPIVAGPGFLTLMDENGIVRTLTVPLRALALANLSSGDIVGYSADATGLVTGLSEKKAVYASEKSFTLSASYAGLAIDSDAAIFTFGEAKNFGLEKATFTSDSLDYGIRSLRLMRNVTTSAYYVLEGSKITAMIVPTDVGYSGRMYGLIQEIGTAANLDGDQVDLVDLLIGEDTVTILTNGSADTPGVSLYAESGELFELTLRNGVITNIADSFIADYEDLGLVIADSNDFGVVKGDRFAELTQNEFIEIVTYDDVFVDFTDGRERLIQPRFGIMKDVVVYELNEKGDYVPASESDIRAGAWIRGYDVTDDGVDYADVVVVSEFERDR